MRWGWVWGKWVPITMTQGAGPGLGHIFKSWVRISSQSTLALDPEPYQSESDA